ncbi:hypothetical protein GRF29_1536g1462167, partial [Pseudopithomyces chartarum]
PFIANINFTEATLVKRSLQTFFGIGPKVSQGIMARFHIQPWAKVGSLKQSTLLDLTAELSKMKIENDLRREIQDNILRLKDMGTYRGRRHAMGLPVRGQRTRTQIATARRLNRTTRGGDRRLRLWILIEADACTIPAMPHPKHTNQVFAFVVQSYKLYALYGRWAFRNRPYWNLSWEGQRLEREFRLQRAIIEYHSLRKSAW